ncbi:MAG TPA: cation diffusion facilitator family transporter [Solirubrobacteraceae bacterium]|jgi:cation diffusion facilitator family transporter|nr:cation diffusion facilitator family transporter [Solirubrobacteraceae bacterium]
MTAGKTSSAQRVALASVLAAALLVAIKLVVGLLSNSLGVLAEAIHSATDLAAALLTLFAVRVAVRPADRDHPYGHGKAEHLSALGESVILIAASMGIATESVIRLSGHGGKVDLHWYTFAVLVVVIAIDSTRSISSRRGAHRHESAALGANALHFTLDLIGSVAVLIGLVLVKAGYPDADSIAALLVAGLALFSAGRLMRRSVHALMDRVSPEDELNYASALLVLRLAPESTQADAEALAKHLRAEHPEVAEITVRAPKENLLG